jgi:hypothetical protein
MCHKHLDPYKPLELVPSWAQLSLHIPVTAMLLLAASTAWRSPDSGMYFLVHAHLVPSTVPSLGRKYLWWAVAVVVSQHTLELSQTPTLVHSSTGMGMQHAAQLSLCYYYSPTSATGYCSTAQPLILWSGYGVDMGSGYCVPYRLSKYGLSMENEVQPVNDNAECWSELLGRKVYTTSEIPYSRNRERSWA